MKVFVWTVACVALGVALATLRIDGRTPWDHLQRAWHHQVTPARMTAVKERVGDLVDDAKDALASSKTPREHHSTDDRVALNKLIAHRPTPAR